MDILQSSGTVWPLATDPTFKLMNSACSIIEVRFLLQRCMFLIGVYDDNADMNAELAKRLSGGYLMDKELEIKRNSALKCFKTWELHWRLHVCHKFRTIIKS